MVEIDELRIFIKDGNEIILDSTEKMNIKQLNNDNMIICVIMIFEVYLMVYGMIRLNVK